jgi:sporulation related protein
MSMAEDTRYRSDDARESDRQDRPDVAHEPSNDPLTELARLIGQSDPFGEPRGRRAHLDAQDDRPAPGWLARPSDSPADDHAGHADHSYAERSYGAYRQHDPQHDPSYDHDPAQDAYTREDRYAHVDHADARYAGEAYAHGDDRYRVAPPAADYESEDYYDDGHLPPRGEDDGLLHGRRRGGLITVAAVVGLAVIGTAGAFGYRAFTGPSAASPPPVIKADPTPAKTTPAAPTADAQDKPFQDRVGNPGTVQTERIVPREEAPVSQPVPPAAVAPWPTPPAPRAAAPVAPVAPAPADATKRVRTETIRMSPAGEVTATTKAAATPPARAAKQNGPMAIAPEAPAPSTRTAARTAPAADGAYVVQVSAQKTESEAQSSYRALQAKYPAVLGGREPTIRRADLGDKGVYYRAQIGGFASAGEATAFCDNLKAAGGQCIVQKN